MSNLTQSKQALDVLSHIAPGGGLRRSAKFLLIYTAALTLSLCLAYAIRFDFEIPDKPGRYVLYIMAGVVPVQLLSLYAFRQFRLLPAYFGISALLRMLYALSCSAALLIVARWRLHLGFALPFGVILLDWLLGLVILTCMCYLWRLYRHGHLSLIIPGGRKATKRGRRVAIIGAGDSGLDLAQELQRKPHLGLCPVAFFDDDSNKWKARMQELPVLGPPELLTRGILRIYKIDEIILSLPSAPATRIREILNIIAQTGLEHRTVPSLAELAAGNFKVSHLRTVQNKDLLGREPVTLHTKQIQNLLEGRRVMVTGSGGSIGKELCRQVAAQGPSELLLIERSEVQMFEVEQELVQCGYREVIRPLVANILDEARMRRICANHKPDIIFHAAAHKHVPMMESQPEEAIRNNTFGTALLAGLAIECSVDRFVLISTDKAINPTSVMGASKRLAEMIVQDFQARNHTSTRFMAVRFGNVIGSSGSVVPLFRKQIISGGPVTVTHPQMTRYFMTIPEAVGLVLQSTVEANGGEIFLLDMGKPLRIVDLAKNMIRLYGFKPGKDIQIVFTGIRPGEKLFEEMSYSEESVTPTLHPKIMRVRCSPPDPSVLRRNLQMLEKEINAGDPEQLKSLLKRAVPEYRAPVAPNRTANVAA